MAIEQPEEPVKQLELWTWMTAFQTRKLLAQGQILKQQTFLRAKEANEVTKKIPRKQNMANSYTSTLVSERPLGHGV